MLERLSRKCNSDRFIQKTVRRERRERKRDLKRGQAVWGWRWAPATSLPGA
jgi:hypothetical protein